MTAENARKIAKTAASEMVKRLTEERMRQSWREDVERTFTDLAGVLDVHEGKDQVQRLAFLLEYDPRRCPAHDTDTSRMRIALRRVIEEVFDEMGDIVCREPVEDDDIHESYTDMRELVSNED